MKNMPTVAIGIPAYNEEENIKNLLYALLGQKEESFILEKIIVVSDGSEDKTDHLVRSIKDERISLIRNRLRIGQPKSQNIIVKKSTSDILVIINGDVSPKGKEFLEELIKPFLSNNNIGIVGANTQSAPPRNYFENVVITGRAFKKNIYKKINDGSCVYLCHGRGRAFSKRLYKSIKWVDDCAEDSYSYFCCIEKRMKFVYCEDAMVSFRSPLNLSGHKKQSDRFFEGKNNLNRHFDSEIVDYEYVIPKKLLIQELYISLLKYPLKMPAFISVALYLTVLRLFARSTINKNNYSLWNVTDSSKKV